MLGRYSCFNKPDKYVVKQRIDFLGKKVKICSMYALRRQASSFCTLVYSMAFFSICRKDGCFVQLVYVPVCKMHKYLADKYSYINKRDKN